MATISSTLALNDKISGTLRTITTAMSSTLAAMRSIKGVDIGSEFAKAAADIKLAERAIDSLDNEMAKLSKSPQGVGDGFTVLKGIAVNVLSSIASAAREAVGDVVRLADQTTTQAARLSMVNDGLQTQMELQESIFQTAQRTRSSYAAMMDTVAKLNLQAGDAFSTNKEAIAYAELLSKSFKIAGADIVTQTQSTRQLIQALGSGVLRGDELNSIFEAAPNLIRNIADYLEVPIGQIRDMAGEGQITADIVKASMFSAADDINAKFAEMPMTIAEIGTVSANVLLKSFTPVLQAIGEGARYVYENWEKVGPVFVGVATSVGILTVALAGYALGMGIAHLVTVGFLSLPIINIIAGIALAIGLIVGAIYKWVQATGGIEIAWATAMDGIQTVVGATKVAVLSIFEGMVNGGIDLINKLISHANKIPGVGIDLIGHVTFGAAEALEREVGAHNLRLSNIATMRARAAAEAVAPKDTGFDMSEVMTTGAGGKALKVKNTEKLITEEDIRMFTDIANQEYLVQFRQFTPTATIQWYGDVNNGQTADEIIDQLAYAMEEMSTSSLEVPA